MGKKRRLNRLITKWIKSDLPEDRSTVLLLGVTRIPTSPTPVRRPCSLPLTATTQLLPFAPNPNPNPNPDRSTDPVLVQELAGVCGSSSSSNPTTTTTVTSSSATVTPRSHVSPDSRRAPLLMDQSVDSIGTCSLDVDASYELQEWSEASSLRTLRSESIPESGTPQEAHKLPSYLSLACTVNGYSTTINYDPERLARSRDASPHRLHDHDHSHQPPLATYSVHNNLLSPPNLVPLPTTPQALRVSGNTQGAMAEHTFTTHHQIYSSTKTVSFATKSIFTADLDHNRKNLIHNKAFSYASATNGQTKEAKYAQTQTDDSKSFIEQRIERLYGPGALAHGFLVMKKQHNRSFEPDREHETEKRSNAGHSKSMLDRLLDDEADNAVIKQSSSFPSLPVLRHLRPEFRAQLPIMNAKKGAETICKSSTIPVIKEEVKTNGHGHSPLVEPAKMHVNGNSNSNSNGADSVMCGEPHKKIGQKDGHHFLEILENEATRLLALAAETEAELENENQHLNEEAKGYLRSASGKAKLLVSQKMQQFKGLCTKNITQVEGEAFPTTNEDLQGFWDMVMLQVDQVDMLFKEIKALKANNWVEKAEDVVDKPKVNGTSRVKKLIKSKPPSAEAEEARKQRETQRKQMIEARRKAMREQRSNAASQQQNIEIFVPESS